MNILLVYPEYPDTFWSFKTALKFIAKKAAHPPLGLLTVAAMLPEEWNKKVIDMNIAPLKEKDLIWADYVFISAMVVQKASVQAIIGRCKDHKVKVVAGGPLFSDAHEDFANIDHLVLNEAEITLPQFLADVRNGRAKHVYHASGQFPELDKTPLPRWDLIDMSKYASMSIQYSRGCPFNCEFCNITSLFGRRVRTKTKDQMLAELDNLYVKGWRGDVFIVDDNFIGNKLKLKNEILPAMMTWMKARKYPFLFTTESSINLADDDALLRLMTQAGFYSVFVGIETPDETSLTECNKFQNKNRNLIDSVEKIQKAGLEVTAGFIVGFDSDSPSIFKRQVEFIKNSRIVTAMVGLLNAPKNTALYHRLKNENRLLNDISGSNTDFSLNFIPKMDAASLVAGYRKIIKEIYSVKPYYARIRAYLNNIRRVKRRAVRINISHIKALLASMVVLGIKDRGRFYFWRLFFTSMFRQGQFPIAITYSIYGYHFRRVFADCMY
ncbi:MAG: DUF4070 domain-containing protein [archaeon]